MVAPSAVVVEAATQPQSQKPICKVGAALESKPSLTSHPCDDGTFGDSETPRSAVCDVDAVMLPDSISAKVDAAEPEAKEAESAAAEAKEAESAAAEAKDAESAAVKAKSAAAEAKEAESAALSRDAVIEPPSELKEAPHTPDICGNGLAPSRVDTTEKGKDSVAQDTETFQISAEVESHQEYGSVAASDTQGVQGVAAAEALLLAVSDQATKGALPAVRTVNNPKSCSSSEVTPPTTPPAGSTPTGDKGKPTDTSSEEADSPKPRSKALSPVTVLPAGAHNAQEFVPASPASVPCEAALGSETPCLSGRSSVTLNHNAPEFKMPGSAVSSGTAASAAAAEGVSEGADADADVAYTESVWYPDMHGAYDAAAYGYVDEHGHAYYPNVSYQGGMYGYYDYGYSASAEYDYSNGYGQEQQWTFGTYDAQADAGYWDYNSGSVEQQGSIAPSVSDNEHGLAGAFGEAQGNVFPASAGSEMATPDGGRANQVAGQQRKRLGGQPRTDRIDPQAYTEAALIVLQQQFTGYNQKTLQDVFMGLSRGDLEEALDRLGQMEAEQDGLLPKQGDRKAQAQFKPPPKLDNEADFPVLGAPSKKPASPPGAKERNFIDALRKGSANPGAPEGDAAVETPDAPSVPAAASDAADVATEGPKKAVTDVNSTGTAANDQASNGRKAAVEFKKQRNMYFNKAVTAFRNKKEELAAQLAKKGRDCQIQMIQAYAAISEPIFVVKSASVLSRGSTRNGQRVPTANRHGSKAAGPPMIDLHGLQQTEAVERLDKEVARLKKAAQQNNGRKQRLRVIVGAGRPRPQGGNTKGSPKEQPRKVFKAVEAYLKEQGLKFEERDAAVEVEI